MKRSVWEDRKEFWFDRKAAYNVCAFLENEIIHLKGPQAGEKLKLERWQRRFIRRAYGWKRRDDNTRRYRTVFLFVPRKNGKSLLGAGLALYGLFADNEMGAEVVSAAVDRDQARIIFDVAAEIVRRNPRLSRLCKVYSRTIVVHHTASKYSVLSADVENKHGQNPSTVIFDELHTQPDGKLVEVLKTGMQARSQPLQIYFTTAGHDVNSICYEYYDRAKRIMSREDSEFDPTFLPVIYEATKDDDWKDPKTWAKANPNFGVSVIPNNYRIAFQEALANRREENSFKRLYLNIWTETEELWLDMDQWDDCAKPTFDPLKYKGETFVAGLDLSSKIDVTAFVLMHLNAEKELITIPYFWLPEADIRKREEKDGVPYRQWADDGHLILTPGQVVDYDRIRAKINEIGDIFNIKEIGFDPWNAIDLATKLERDGFQTVEIRQGYPRLSEPSKELEAFLAERMIRHNGNPILRWMASNAACEEDAQGNIKPSKAKSRKRRNDGIQAMVTGLSRLIVLKHRRRSRYEDEGLDSV